MLQRWASASRASQLEIVDVPQAEDDFSDTRIGKVAPVFEHHCPKLAYWAADAGCLGNPGDSERVVMQAAACSLPWRM
jgi:hypothetical protein